MSPKPNKKRVSNWRLQRLTISKPKLILLFLVGILLLGLLFVANFGLFQLRVNSLLENSVNSENWHTFHLESYPLSIEYPDLWVAHETPQGNHGDNAAIAGISFPSGFNFAPFIQIAKKWEITENLNNIADWGQLRALQLGYKSFSLNPIEIDGNQGLIRDYRYRGRTYFGTYTMACQDLYLWEAGVGYAFTFCADKDEFEHFKPMFQKMQDSIQLGIEPQQPTSTP